jgi:alpha-tubulin suppressor-like RCC1 family protein
MSYRILSSNVILGGGSIPEYALVAAPDGALQIERLDGNAAVLDVGGNLECEHLTLTSLTPENRVITTDPAGRLIVTGFDADGLGNASALTSGTLPGDRLQGGSYTFANLTTTGGVTAGSLVANIDAANIISGILPAGRLVGDYNFGNLTLSNTLTAATLAANISADNLTSGTLSDDRLSGPYAFGSLTLTGNLDAAWVNANLSATNLVTGVLDPARLQGSYTFDTLTVSNVLTANAVEIPTLLGSNVLVSDGTGTITTSNVTQTELAYLSGVVSPVQTQINELGNGNIVGSNITNLDANNLTFGVVPDDRLQGAYAFDSLTLTGSLVANSVSGNLDASQLVSGVVPSQRLAGSYAVTNLTASGTVTAGTVSGNLNASQLVSGTVPASRLAGGSYSFTSLDLTGNLDAGTINANVDAASLVSGTVDNVRLDLEGLVTNVTPALTNLTLGTPSNAWSHVHATTVHVDDVELGNAIMYNGNAVVVDLEQTTRSIVAAGPEYTIGTQTTPWSNVYAANVLVGNVILSGSLLNSNLETYLDLSNVATNVNPATAGLTIGTVDRPWTNVVATSANVQTFAVSGNVTSDLVPATSGLDLGSAAQRWGNLYADHLYANVDAADIYGELDANIVFTGGSIDDFVIKAPAGTAAQPGLRFTDDDQTGFFLPAPGTMGVSCANATALTLDASRMTVSGNVVPGANASYDLGNATVAWRDVHIANALHAGPVTISGGSVSGVTDLTVSANLDAGNVVATGTVSGSTLTGTLDASYLTGTIDPARIAGDYAVSNLTITGAATVAGTTTIQPSGHIVPQSNLVYDLGSSTNVWRDLYLAGSTIHLGNATIHEETGNVVISKMKITGSIVADGLLPDMSISNVQICDTNWSIVDDTAVSTDGGKFLVNGSGFGPGCLCQVGGVNASSTSYVSPAQLRVEVGARATGTYPITVVRGDTQIATLPSGLTYSNVVTWITSSTLGDVEYGQSFTIPLVATSDSSVWYANVTSLPADTTLDPFTGNLSGNITSVTTSTLFAFDVDAVDHELQDARRSFLLQLLVLLINGATYTDASWNALTQTALDANSGSVYFTVDGTGMNEVTGVFVGGTPATSFTALDDSTLRVTGPQKPRGTYDVTLQTASGSKTLPNGVFYSDVPTWTSPSLVSKTVANSSNFSISLDAKSDSNVSYVVETALPPQTTLDALTGNLDGNITTVNVDTTYVIGIRATDSELQSITRSFQLEMRMFNILSIHCILFRSYIRTSAGLIGAGRNSSGEIGDGTTDQRDSFVTLPGTGSLIGKTVTSISGGGDHTVFLCSDSSIHAVGNNASGALGDGTTESKVSPIDITNKGSLSGKVIVEIACGHSFTIFRASDSSVHAVGFNGYGQLNNGTTTSVSTPINISGNGSINGRTIVKIACGGRHTVFVDSLGKCHCVGNNNFGGLGDGSTTNRSLAVDISNNGSLSGKTVVDVACGVDAYSAQTIFIASDSSCHGTGWNIYGQLGDGSFSNKTTPIELTNLGTLSGRTVVQVACSRYSTQFLTSDGVVHGAGYVYQYPTYPKVLNTSGKKVKKISNGYHTMMYLTEDNTVLFIGSNGDGQYGDGTLIGNSYQNPKDVTQAMFDATT